MPRKGPVTKRVAEPDPVYRNSQVTQIINKIMTRGKKGLAQNIVYGSLQQVSERTGGDPTQTLKKALDRARPLVEVRSRRVGGATYQVPVEVHQRRGNSLAVRWLVSSARTRKGNTMVERLASEILDASAGGGSAVKRREDLHKMAEANKAFAHYRW